MSASFMRPPLLIASLMSVALLGSCTGGDGSKTDAPSEGTQENPASPSTTDVAAAAAPETEKANPDKANPDKANPDKVDKGEAAPSATAKAASSNGLQSGPASPQVVSNARKIQRQLECLRGLKFKRDPAVALQSLDDFRSYVDKQLAKELGGDKGARQVRALHALDIVDPSVDVMKQLVEAAVGQAAAYYDPETDTFYMVQDMPELMLNNVMAHELQHALQDQHTSLLDDYLAEGFGSTDKDLATRFIVEGEATLLGSAWLVNHIQSKLPNAQQICHLPGESKGDPRSFWPDLHPMMAKAASQTRDDTVNPGMLERMAMSSMSESMGESLKQLKQLPVYFFYSLLLPYNQGGQTVYSHFAANSYEWASIDALFTTPPESTEQVLHPHKLLGDREGFRDHELSETAPLRELAAANWHSDPPDRLGELSVMIWLIEEGVDEKSASEAATGWDGDKIRVWRKSGDLLAFDWKIGWDSSTQRKRFMAKLPSAIATQRAITNTDILQGLASGSESGEVVFSWTDTQGRTRHGRIGWSADEVHWTDGWDQPVVWP